MSDLIPDMTITEFKKLHARDIKRMKSVEVYSDGEHLFTALIPKGDFGARDYIKIEAEALGLRSNISGGLDPQESKVVVSGIV